MTVPSLPQNPELLPYQYILSRLMLRTAAAKSKEELIFLITNETTHLLPYQRAFLISFEKGTPKVIGISGQSKINENAPLVAELEKLSADLKEPHEAKLLNKEAFKKEVEWDAYQKSGTSAGLWLPIFFKNQQVLALWIEQTGSANFAIPAQGIIALLTNFLMHDYGIAWDRVTNKSSLSNWFSKGNRKLSWILAPILAALAFIPIPLRITAPCEIISSSPYVIRAPLNGVVKEVLVLPGQSVKKDDPLFAYDPEIPTHTLEAAREEVREKQLQLDRAALLGMQNQQSLNELNLLQIKLQKERISLALADYEASLLVVKSPQEGVVILDSPDGWRGHPVNLGEKVMLVSDPKTTRVKIWIPESDNVPLDVSKPIKVYLSISPFTSYPSQIEYVANESTLSEKEIPSYVAKADWIGTPPKDARLGLKGTAVLYGDSVPLIYYIMRKPWFTFRNYIGF